MKRVIIVALLSLFPLQAGSHPGKTDKYGGHKCLHGCGEWSLLYGEYHEHDKYGKPIRIKRDRHARQIAKQEVIQSEDSNTVIEKPVEVPQVKPLAATPAPANDFEEDFVLADPLVLALLALLLLLLFLVMRRRKNRK